TGHRSAIYALEKGKTPQNFLTSGGDGWIVEWDIASPETGKRLATAETQVFSLCHLPEKGKIIAGTMNGGLHWIDLQHPER
ncbi:hypothetical protein, partial [Lactococcus petauri]|uniref:hypothetical protein n=1 Tax=Lactococcus petauri TaxID=1940789 RepID=UPI0021F19972